MTLLTFTSDFGTRDAYVASVKGVLLTRLPELRIVDVSHEIPPGDIVAGAYVLAQAVREFPAGTLHLAVVDPGVGSGRRAIATDSRADRSARAWAAPYREANLGGGVDLARAASCKSDELPGVRGGGHREACR